MTRIYGIILSLGVIVIALDQWTKTMALEALQTEGTSQALWGWFQFTLVHNYGAAFGMMKAVPAVIRTGFFLMMPLSILTVLWWFYVRTFKKDDLMGPLAIGLVFGGAVGNMIDRVRHGYVVDFIDWFYTTSSNSCIPLFFPMNPANSCHWPVFNVADSAISIAMVVLVIHSIRNNPQSDTAKPSNK